MKQTKFIQNILESKEDFQAKKHSKKNYGRYDMKKKFLIFTLSLFTIFATINQGQSATPEWKFDTAHSSFNFHVKHIFSTISGYFKDFDGYIRFDADNLADSSMNFKIKVKSVQTKEPKRDNHLRTDDFFGAEKYPLITFKSSSIKHTEENQYAVTGDLTIKDVTKTIELPFTYYGIKDHPLNQKEKVLGFDTHLKLNRLEYNVGNGKFYDLGVVDKDVNITVSLEMVRPR